MSAWQPIGTAPKDGTVILLATAGRRCSDAGFWDGDADFPWAVLDPNAGGEDPHINGYQEHAVTHWMPLPKPPIASGAAEGSQA